MIEKRKFTQQAMEDIKSALNTFKDFFSIIHILHNNVDKQCLIAPHDKSAQKLIELRNIRKSIFWIVGPFSQMASHMAILF